MHNVKLPVAVFAFSVIAVGPTYIWRWNEGREFLVNAHHVMNLRSTTSVASAERMTNAASGDEFASHLAHSAYSEPIVGLLQGLSTAKGITFASLSTSGRPASEKALGRVELAASLRGSYGDIKDVLGDVLERSPNLVVQRLSLRHVPAGANLEAHVDFLVPTRPEVSQ